MGQKNNVLNVYMSKPERIQSVLEYYIGEKLPQDWALSCEEAPGFYAVVNAKGKVSSRQRDILKRIKTESGNYLLGIENQDKINLTFPWRLMQMDCLAYERQIVEIQERNKNKKVRYKECDDYLYRYKAEDYLEPVVNLVLYWGKRKWQKPLCLKDMVKFPIVSAKIERLFADYGIHMIDMRSIPDEALEVMNSDLKYVLGLIKCGNSKKKYIEYVQKHRDFFQKIPKSAVDVINVCTSMGKLNEVLNFAQTEDGEERADMCKAVDDLIKDSVRQGRKQGRKQGRSEGREVLLTLIQKMTDAGEAGMIPRLSKEPEFLRSMYKKYKLEF